MTNDKQDTIILGYDGEESAHLRDEDGHKPWGGRSVWPWLIFALIATIGGCVAWAVPNYEKYLDKSARADMDAAGIPTENLELDWDFNDVTLSGELPRGVAKTEVQAILEKSSDGGIDSINTDCLLYTSPSPRDS